MGWFVCFGSSARRSLCGEGLPPKTPTSQPPPKPSPIYPQMRKPQAHQFIRPKGMAGAAGFQPVLQDVTNLSGSQPAEEEAAPEPDKPVAAEERTWEPLVLWSGTVETVRCVALGWLCCGR